MMPPHRMTKQELAREAAKLRARKRKQFLPAVDESRLKDLGREMGVRGMGRKNQR